MNYTTLIIEKENAIAILTINRPDKLNALNTLCLSEINDALEHIAKDTDIRCLIITGSGEKAFVAGADIAELQKLTSADAQAFSEKGQSVFNLIDNFPKPVIAAVNGFALGGGAELAWSCHIRIASENASFGQPEINLGLIPGYGGTQRLTRLLPVSLAAEYLLTGSRFDANTALRCGLINRIAAPAELLDECKKLAQKITAQPAKIIELMLKTIRTSKNYPLSEGLAVEAELFAQCFQTEDCKEGLAAFLEKRKPQFTHR